KTWHPDYRSCRISRRPPRIAKFRSPRGTQAKSRIRAADERRALYRDAIHFFGPPGYRVGGFAQSGDWRPAGSCRASRARDRENAFEICDRWRRGRLFTSFLEALCELDETADRLGAG